jgi:hypothetical protein
VSHCCCQATCQNFIVLIDELGYDKEAVPQAQRSIVEGKQFFKTKQ